MTSLLDKSGKIFLKRGEGRLGTSMPLVPAGTTNPPATNSLRTTKRSLQLKRPQSDGTIEDDEPRSYAEIHARQTIPRPMSAPATPDKVTAARKGAPGTNAGDKEGPMAAFGAGSTGGDPHARASPYFCVCILSESLLFAKCADCFSQFCAHVV
jgi:hypothetical protein